MLKTLALLLVPLVMGGCASMATLPVASLLPPNASSVDFHSQTAIKLEQANFTVVKTNVIGRCKGFALLGLITLSPAKFSKAIDRLYAQAEMQPGKPQTMVNVVIERSSSFFILFSIPQVSVRGDLVEFVRPESALRPGVSGEVNPVQKVPDQAQ